MTWERFRLVAKAVAARFSSERNRDNRHLRRTIGIYHRERALMTLRFGGSSILLLICLCAAAVCADAAAPQTKQETQSPKVRAIGRRLKEKGVTNFGEVTPQLYRGGLLKGDGLQALKRLGVNVVVDTHAHDKNEEKEVEALGMKYVAIPWHCPWPKDEVFAK